MADPSARADLTKRQIPFMTLASGLSDLPGASLRTASATDTAESRFALPGTAVVTGGTGAIAQAVVRAMLQHGLTGLMLLDLDVASAEAAGQIAALRGEFPEARIEAQSVDVTDEAGVAAAMERAAAALGGVDYLVCFAGVVGCVHALEMPAAQFRRILDINTTGAFVCAQAAARVMVRQGRGGRVVFTASISAHRVNFPQPQAAYNTSKGALLQLKSSLAAEWARYGITVNSISPGYMDTVLNEGEGLREAREVWAGRNPAGRMGMPEEVGGVVVMLCSRAGSYFNGSDLVVDGGGVGGCVGGYGLLRGTVSRERQATIDTRGEEFEMPVKAFLIRVPSPLSKRSGPCGRFSTDALCQEEPSITTSLVVAPVWMHPK
ncbi:short-chain dehydrogenase/reductase family [Colletotrichum tofieldiae]|uniref:Short-chain dehydrogenase/reductase family n=1 Tax=Colletotrichum tofieldiae TaxID=708197 RepID=A0A161Y570_9PEZI|nr:short-chain dehydrogenase/reductase family [Colletotrichum tofieldiae]